MGRHEQREQLFRLLFRIEFNSPEDMPEQLQLFFQDDEINFSQKVRDSIEDRYALVLEKLPQIDKMLDEKAEGWDTRRMGKVELTILRLGVFEMLFDDDIPVNVAINEAVEIAKQYGQETSGGFVNAVLAKFVPEKE